MTIEHNKLNAEELAHELQREVKSFIQIISSPKYADVLKITNLLITDEEYATSFVLQLNAHRLTPCPQCRATGTISLKLRKNKIKNGNYCCCSKCGHQFSPWIGTPLIATKKGITKWMQKIFQIIDPINRKEPTAAPRTIKRMENILSRSGISAEIFKQNINRRAPHGLHQELLKAAWKVKELSTAIEFYQITKSFIENRDVTDLFSKCPK